MGVKRTAIKREVDLQIFTDWITPGSRVLDLGCGRGILLEHLAQTKDVYAVGVDTDGDKVASCVKRGVSAYQGDINDFLKEFPDQYFDWVVCSRTLTELSHPKIVLEEALRAGKRLAVGFVNYGFWLNRWFMLVSGTRVQNDVYPRPWYETRRANPVSVGDFERFCRDEQIEIYRRAFLSGDWHTPCRFWPDLLAGYALFEIGYSKQPPPAKQPEAAGETPPNAKKAENAA